MTPNAPLNWTEAVERLSQQTGVVMLVGATDVGKTTLALMAANAACEAGRKAAILDADLGQGEVGPPGTLGAVRLEQPAAALNDLKPRAMAFVGDTTPVGHFLPVIQGTRRLVRHCLDRQDDVVFVDTSGMVAGRMAEKLKLAKLDALEPDLVVVVQRNNELERLATLMQLSSPAPVLFVRSPRELRTKTQVYRRVQRANRTRRHFEGAQRYELDAGQVRVIDAWLYNGMALSARDLQLAGDALGTSVPHGEHTADGVYLCVTGTPNREGFADLQEQFKRRRVTVCPAAHLQHLLVGLIGPEGRLVDIGLLQGINFERAVMSILTPARSVAEVRMLHFGRLRLRADGSEIGRLRPSDL